MAAKEVEIKLMVSINLKSEYYKRTKRELRGIAQEMISEYLSVRKENQFGREEDFDAENGFLIGDYEVKVLNS